MLVADALSFASNGRALLADANLQLGPGEVVAVLGPNGAGKSTLLRLLSGELRASTGRVTLNGKPIERWSASELARQRAVLPQSESLRFAFDARSVVALGRYPWGESEGTHADRIVDAAMRATAVAHLASRSYTRLSAGERARVQLARVLAQVWEPQADRPRYLFLDEPTASLDLAHQHDVLAALREFAAKDAGVMIVLHDLNLALDYADRVLLLHEGRLVAAGTPQEVLTPSRIATVFDIDVESLHRANGAPWIVARGRRPSAPAAP